MHKAGNAPRRLVDGFRNAFISNQEHGVDKTDYVKSNGGYVFVANGNLLRVLDLGGKVVRAARVVGGASARGLHLAGKKLVLITQSTVANPHLSPAIDLPLSAPDYWWSYWGYWRQRIWYYEYVTNVHEFEITDDGALNPVKDRRYAGTFPGRA